MLVDFLYFEKVLIFKKKIFQRDLKEILMKFWWKFFEILFKFYYLNQKRKKKFKNLKKKKKKTKKTSN